MFEPQVRNFICPLQTWGHEGSPDNLTYHRKFEEKVHTLGRLTLLFSSCMLAIDCLVILKDGILYLCRLLGLYLGMLLGQGSRRILRRKYKTGSGFAAGWDETKSFVTRFCCVRSDLVINLFCKSTQGLDAEPRDRTTLSTGFSSDFATPDNEPSKQTEVKVSYSSFTKNVSSCTQC